MKPSKLNLPKKPTKQPQFQRGNVLVSHPGLHGWKQIIPNKKPLSKMSAAMDKLVYTILDFDYITQRYKVKVEDSSGRIISKEIWEQKEFIEGECVVDVVRTLNNIEENF